MIDALAMIEQSDEDYQTLVKYALTIFIYGNSREELVKAQSDIERICRLYGVTPVREGWVSQASWFCQFPTYDKLPQIISFAVTGCGLFNELRAFSRRI